MKKFLLTLMLCLPLLTVAQDLEGHIIYNCVVKMDFDENRQIPPHVREMLKQMPKEQSFKKQLLFNSEASLFTTYEDPDAPVVIEEGMAGRMRMMMMRPEEETYTSLKENRFVQKKDFMGRTFLIKDSIEESNWKLTGEQKTILDMPCMKATTMRDSAEIVAWFTPAIPVAMGPEGASQLPGMIMEITLREGRVTITAEKFEARSVKAKEIKEPTKGKEVTREEFREMVKEKRKEMREMGGGRGPGGGRPPMR